MRLTEFSLRRPVTMVMVTFSAVILGIVSLERLPIEQLPSVSSSGVTASAQYQNSSPEEIERKLTIPLEAALGTLSHIERISSSSGRNSGSVRIDFKPGTDMDLATMRMRERVDQARAFMPADVDRVSLRRWQSDQRPVIYANLAWHGEGDRLLISPAGDIESLRAEAVELTDIELPAHQEIVVDEVRGNAMEIIATIDPGEARYIRLNVLRAADKSEYTAVNFHRDVGKDYANRSWSVRDSMITLDPTFSTVGAEGEINQPQSCHFHYHEGELLELRIFVDRSIVEVFVNGQSACLTRVYPEGTDSDGFSIEARGHRARCRKLQAWTMERVFL